MVGIFKRLRYYLKSAISVMLLGGASSYGVVSSMICALAGSRRLAQWLTARCFYHMMRLVLGLKVEVRGAENLQKKPCIYVSNHQSSLDVFVIGKLFTRNTVVTAKRSLMYVPVLGWYMLLSGTLFLDRQNGRKSIDTLNRSLDTVKKHNGALWVFPEGTRSYSKTLDMLPFKKGAFFLAQQGGLPIVPVVISNTSNLVDSRTHTFERGTVIVQVLEPIPTEDLKSEDIPELTTTIREKMLDALQNNVKYSITNSNAQIPPPLHEQMADGTEDD